MGSPIILFDGVCHLCARSLRFVVRRDPAARFRFCSLQSEAGRKLLREHGLPPDELTSVVVIDGERVYRRSDAVLRICSGLRRPWRWARWLRVIPRAPRDLVYDLVARRRYRWFGRADACLVPTDELLDRFLDQDEGPGGADASAEPGVKRE